MRNEQVLISRRTPKRKESTRDTNFHVIENTKKTIDCKAIKTHLSVRLDFDQKSAVHTY